MSPLDQGNLMISNASFTEKCLIVLGVVAGAVLLYSLANLVLLVFAAVLFALIFSMARELITRRTGLSPRLALPLAIIGALAVMVGIFALFGAQIGGELQSIRERLPAALNAAQGQLDRWGLGAPLRDLLDQLSDDASSLLTRAGGYVLSAGSGLADLLLILFGGIFIAAQPALYRKGVLALVPRRWEALVAEALDDSGRALRGWLRGQLLSMLVVAVFTGAGLWLLGVPAALGLALIAGLMDVIPFIGPIIAAVPGVLLAFTAGPAMALWTALLYLVVQQVQGNILQPLIQKHAVDIAPAVLLFSIGAFGILFGILGIILAAPLTVVTYALVRRLYVQAMLGKGAD